MKCQICSFFRNPGDTLIPRIGDERGGIRFAHHASKKLAARLSWRATSEHASSMDVVVKLGRDTFEKLRAAIPSGSPVVEALELATPIDYAVDGVIFSGYEITCNYEQVQLLHQIAKKFCGEATFDIEKALRAAAQR